MEVVERVIVEGIFINSEKHYQGQVEITNGIISNIGQNLGKANIVFDNNHLIFPGMGDIHVHAREDNEGSQNYKEDYNTTEAAAVNGGVVHVAAMPNTPQPLLTDKQLEWHQYRCNGLQVHFLHYAGIGPGTKPLNSHVPYKVYTGPSIGPLFFKSEKQLRETLCHYRGLSVSFHVEDYDVLMSNISQSTHSTRRPPECVEVALVYVLKLIEDYDLDAKLCHWSLGDKSLDLIKAHRERGYQTSIEVSPMHLYFDKEFLSEKPELSPYLQMNPSLQDRTHRLQLIKALKEGFIDFIATDHSPHTLKEKFKNFGSEEEYLNILNNNREECTKISCLDGISGTPQLDTFGPITTWLMNDHGFTPNNIARVACENPGKFVNKFHTGKGKFGRVEIGYYGSFTVIHPTKPITIQRSNLKTKVRWSPFEGITFPGSVVSTIIKGKSVKF